MDITLLNSKPQRHFTPFLPGYPACIGLDLASSVIQATWVDRDGTCHDKSLKPAELAGFVKAYAEEGAAFAMEACSGCQWWANDVISYGGTAYIIPAGTCRSRNRGMKDDRNDAHGVWNALVEMLAYKEKATFHPCIVRPVENQMDLDLLRCWDERRSRLEAIKRGIVAMLREKEPCAGHSYAEPAQKVAAEALDFAAGLDCVKPSKMPNAALYARMLRGECAELVMLMKEVADMDKEFLAPYAARHPETCGVIQDTVRGVGPVLAAAICIAVNNDFLQFRNSRALAAFTGVVPWHHGTGGKNKIGRMSKKGFPIVKGAAYEASLSRMRADGRLDDSSGVWDKRAVLRDMNLLIREIYNAAVGRAVVIPERDRRPKIPQTISKFKSKARCRMRRLALITRDPVIRDQLGKALRGEASGLVPSTGKVDPFEIKDFEAAEFNPVVKKAAEDMILAVIPGAAKAGKDGR